MLAQRVEINNTGSPDIILGGNMFTYITRILLISFACFFSGAAIHSAQAMPITYGGDLSDGLLHNGGPLSVDDYLAPSSWGNGHLWTFSVNAGDSITITALRTTDIDTMMVIWNGVESDTSDYINVFTSSTNTTHLGYWDDDVDPGIPSNVACCSDPQAIFVAATTGIYTVGVFGLGGASGVPHAYTIQAIGSTASVVPVPAALPLFGTGLAVMGFIGWRRKRKLT